MSMKEEYDEVQTDLEWLKSFIHRNPLDIVNGLLADATEKYLQEEFITIQNYWMGRMKHWIAVKKAYFMWMEDWKKATE